MIMNNLADSYTSAGQASAALSLLKDTLAQRQKLVAAKPDSNEEQANLAWTHGQIRGFVEAQHEYADAVRAFSMAVQMFEKLDQAGVLLHPFPRSRMNDYQRQLALCRKAEQAVKDLDFALKQPAAEMPELLDLRLRYLLKNHKTPAAVATAAKIKELGATTKTNFTSACLRIACVRKHPARLPTQVGLLGAPTKR